MVHKIESLPEMIAILEFGRRGTGDEKVDHQNRPEFSNGEAVVVNAKEQTRREIEFIINELKP